MRSRHTVEQNAGDLFKQSSLRILKEKQMHNSMISSMQAGVLTLARTTAQDLRQVNLMLRKESIAMLRSEKSGMEGLVRTVSNMHPVNVLKRGYSITRINGRAITSIEGISASDIIQTSVADGSIFSEVSEIKKNPQP